MTTDLKTVPASWVYMTRGGETVRPIGVGDKAVFVSSYRGTSKIHIRRFFGESNKRFPTKLGMILTRQEYEQLITMQREILADFDRVSQDNQVSNEIEQTTNRNKVRNQNYQGKGQRKQDTNQSSQVSVPNTQSSAHVKQDTKRSNQVNYSPTSTQASQMCDVPDTQSFDVPDTQMFDVPDTQRFDTSFDYNTQMSAQQTGNQKYAYNISDNNIKVKQGTKRSIQDSKKNTQVKTQVRRGTNQSSQSDQDAYHMTRTQAIDSQMCDVPDTQMFDVPDTQRLDVPDTQVFDYNTQMSAHQVCDQFYAYNPSENFLAGYQPGGKSYSYTPSDNVLSLYQSGEPAYSDSGVKKPRNNIQCV